MKKITSKLTLLLMVLAMTFGLVACGGKEFSSISDYLNSDQVKTQLDSVKKQVEGSGMKIIPMKSLRRQTVWQSSWNLR